MVSGKQYYTVTSTDSAMDTGDEVCASVGQSCIGYTLSTNEACKLAHPSASTSSTSSGDASTVYCDGAPQGGVCATEKNTCHSCPTCSAGVSCETPIGGLYREMYVECGSATRGSYAPSTNSCSFNPNAASVRALIGEASAIDAQFKSCSLTLPSTFGAITSNGNVLVDISMNDGTHEYFTITITNKQLTGFAYGQNSCAQRITASEDDVNVLLQSADRATTFQYMYAKKRIKLGGCTFVKKVYGFVTQPLGRFFAGRALPALPSGQTVTPQPGYRVCDFYQDTKKIVTCSAYKAADTFCVVTMQTTSAKAFKCEENGQVICGIPCQLPFGQIQPNQCPFEVSRQRGVQAPPIDSCPNGIGNLIAPSTPTPVAQPQGKPANCDDTHMPGWPEYAQNKALWDAYMSDTDAVCQSRIGTYPNSCSHTIQLSRGGYPFYLCWYNR